MAGVGDLFGRAGSSAEQLFLWGIVAGVVSALGTPYFNALQQAAYRNDPNTPISPEAAAVMVLRHIIDPQTGADEALKSGIANDDFVRMVQAAGEGLPPGALAEALRRGFIDDAGAGPGSTSFEQGIAESNLKAKWGPVVRRLAVQDPSPTDALEALLEGQIGHDEAAALFAKFGGNPEYFDLLFHTRGEAPTPTQALELLNRGIIEERGTGPGATSYEQAFLEGPWRNKWLEPFIALREYVPPPRTVTALLRNGSCTVAQARSWFAASGLAPDAVEAYITDAQHSSSSDDRKLTAAQLISLYLAQLISPADAAAGLEATGYDHANAQYLLALADMRRAISAVNAGVTRIQSLFIGHKIDRSTARDSLQRLGVPADQVKDILDSWDVARVANVKLLTPAQIAKAVKLGWLDDAAAVLQLEGQGYGHDDAVLYLAVELGTINPAALPPAP